MSGTIETLEWLSLAVYLAIAVRTTHRWRTTRQHPAAWAALTFGSLAAVIIIGRAIGEDAATDGYLWLVRALVVVLALFPYLLYRFVASIVRPPAWVARAGTALTAAMVAATLVIPSFPKPEQARPAWYVAYTLLFVAQWIFLFSVVGIRLWSGGKGKPPLIRRRVRFMAVGAAGMNIAIVMGLASPSPDPTPAKLAQQVVGLLAVTAFLIGLTPPRILRNEWRRQQDGATKGLMVALMSAERPAQVAEIMLPFATYTLGVRAIAMLEQDGTVMGSIGIDPGTAVAAANAGAEERERDRIVFEGRAVTVIAWADPYAAFFAPDDLEILHAMGTMTDLVLERCAKIEYERRFIANAAHELRTPLTALSGLSMTLAMRRRQMSEHEIEECFRALERQGDRTRVLIDNLLDLAQLEHGTPDLHPRAVPVAPVAARALEIAPAPDGRTVHLNIDPSLTVLADETRLEQMLLNLLTNAYRYGGPTVTVEAFADVDGVLLVVGDDGPGVPESVLPQLFEPFGRGSVGSNRGSGLGLAIVRRLVTAYGGAMWYEPAKPTGACFKIRLPQVA